MEDNLTDSVNTTFPKFLKLLSAFSGCFGVLLILVALACMLGWATIGAFDYEGKLYLANHRLWEIYTYHFCIALYGVLLFAGGKMVFRNKKTWLACDEFLLSGYDTLFRK